MRIDRRDLDEALSAFVAQGSGLVIGAPGAGKSHALQQLAHRLIEQGQIVLAIPVDQLGDAEESDVRAVLGYRSSTFLDALREEVLPLGTQGVILVDGFDAARSAHVQRNVLRIVRAVFSQLPVDWRVIVSVRAFDAEHAAELLQLFTDEPTVRNGRFSSPRISARHFLVPPLTDAEIEVCCADIAGLPDLMADPRTSSEFRELLRLPFNIWLVERVIGQPYSDQGLRSVVSEVQLLRLYWSRYVRRPANGQDRGTMVQSIARQCVDHRRLTCDLREQLTSENRRAALRDLLSAELLRDDRGDYTRVGFAHNILFDYAVAEHVIGDGDRGVIEFLREDQSRPLFLRSGLNHFFAQLWLDERARFWDMLGPLIESEVLAVRLVGRLVVPSVAVRMARSVDELDPVFAQYGQAGRDHAILRLLQAARFTGRTTSPLWWDFGRRAAEVLSERFAWELGDFISSAQQGGSAQAMDERVPFASALLTSAWRKRSEHESLRPWYDRFIALRALPAFLRTASYQPSKTRNWVETLLGVLEEPNFEIRLLYALADDITQWSPAAPEQARALYLKAFAHTETSREPTEIGGVIIRLVGNRRQDFELVHHVLGRKFAQVFANDPLGMAAVAMQILNLEALNEHVRPYLKPSRSIEDITRKFTFLGEQRSLIPDFSSMWWERVYKRDEVADMIRHVVAELTHESNQIDARAVVIMLAAHATAAVGWRVLLEMGAAAPRKYAPLLFPLVMEREFVEEPSVLAGLRKFITASSPYWEDGELAAFERYCFGVGSGGESGDVTTATGVRAEKRAAQALWRLLSLVPVERLSPGTVQTLAERRLGADNDRGWDDEDDFSSSVGFRSVSRDEELEREGIDLKQEGNESALKFTERLDTLAKQYQNQVPDAAAALELEREVRAAWEYLHSAGDVSSGLGAGTRPSTSGESKTPHPRLWRSVWTAIAGAAGALARTRPREGSQGFSLVNGVLVQSAAFPARTVAPDEDDTFVWASWSPSPRTESIIGLAYLASAEGDGTARAEVIEHVARFASSPAPEERFLAVRYSAVYGTQWTPRYRALLLDTARRERNDVVLEAVLDGLWRLWHWSGRQDQEVVDAVRRIAHERAESGVDDLRNGIALWVAHLAVEVGASWAVQYIESSLIDGRALARAQGRSLGEELQRRLLLYAAPKHEASSDFGGRSEGASDQRHRARDLVIRIVDASGADARLAAADLTARFGGKRAPDDDATLQRLRARHSLVEAVAWMLWQASEQSWTVAQFQEARPLLDAVVRFAAPEGAGSLSASTTHHFVELLARAVDLQPSAVIGYLRRFIEAATAERYQLDTIAVKEIAPVVERILANHRAAVSDGEPLTDLLRLLDVFSDQGWTDAMELVWRLEEIYR